MKRGYTCEVNVICLTEYMTAIDKKIVPVSEKLRRVSVGLRQQWWSSPTEIHLNDDERRLFDISSVYDRRMGLDGRYRNGDRHRDTSLTVEVV